MIIQKIKSNSFKGWLTLMNNEGFKYTVDANKITALTANDESANTNIKAKVEGDNCKYEFPSDYTLDNAIIIIGRARKKPYNHCYDLDFTDDINGKNIDLII